MENKQQHLCPSTFKNVIVSAYHVICLKHVFNFLIFVVGISVGITLSFYVSDFWFNTKIFTSFNYIHPLLSPPPPPPLLTLPLTPSKTIPGPLSFNIETMRNQTRVLTKERPSAMHNMSDEELFLRASMVGRKENSSFGERRSVPKVAFLFLSSGHLHMGPLWEIFFHGYDGFYSIYWHPHPAFDDSYIPKTSLFYRRRIPSQPVNWGSSNMVDAERRLLANALLDLSNQRFVLLSESCIPVFNFTIVYNYLINSQLSFQSIYDYPGIVGRGRYNRQMSPVINIMDWRKGSQWFELNHDLAMNIIIDNKIYPIFQQYCHPPCYVDEHYIPTLINMLYLGTNSDRSVTWVDWSTHGAHPRTFGWEDVSDEFLYSIRFGSICIYNGKPTNICFLFARKFHPNCLEWLLKIAPLLLDFEH